MHRSPPLSRRLNDGDRTAESGPTAADNQQAGNTGLGYNLAGAQSGNAWEVFVDASNLLDEEARPHTSFLKDLAPLPGRGVAFGARLFF